MLELFTPGIVIYSDSDFFVLEYVNTNSYHQPISRHGPDLPIFAGQGREINKTSKVQKLEEHFTECNFLKGLRAGLNEVPFSA